MNDSFDSKTHVVVTVENQTMSIVLNRPHVLNSLTLPMIRRIRAALEQAAASSQIGLVLLMGAGDRAFCAGGDVKALAAAVREGRLPEAMQFFDEEYALDLCIHRFPKPVLAVADGITMGGGLGLAAGADAVIATEKTQLAMPETRIGFFPDVGATGWLFQKCPEGYPEYLGLTGQEITGMDTLRLGFSTHYLSRANVNRALSVLKANAFTGREKKGALDQINALLLPWSSNDIRPNPELDEWVRQYFSGKTSLSRIMDGLARCSIHNDLCDGVFHRLSERSPIATQLTLKLLRFNQGRCLEQVFAIEKKAARFILTQPDYLEGIRSRLLDKDNDPQWRPKTFAEAEKINMDGIFI
ncbi:MAG: enoyl-CoA hydratase/isomerase family protein [Desulfobacterales bacterium]|nr:enoyl-CoA hydratase/isomerase family protein [Desulfobacterales bacterium]